MIRALLVLLSVVLGLAAAVVTQGRMHHLRLALPAALPGWTDTVEAEAGLLSGRAALPGAQPALVLGWEARMPVAEGLRWRVTVTGEGLALAGTLILPWSLDRAALDEGAGQVELARVTEMPVSGLVQVNLLSGTVDDLRGTPRPALRVLGAIRGAQFEDRLLGDGPFEAQLDPLLSWRARGALSGGVAEITARLSGRLPARTAGLDLSVADGPNLPQDWRDLLSLAAERGESGWTLRQTVPLPGL
jgi:hypothetical protein